MKKVTVYITDTVSKEEIISSRAALLSRERREKAERLVNDRARINSLAAGLLVRDFVGEGVVTDRFGKPVKGGVFFNLTHTLSTVALAVCEAAETGIDAEAPRKVGEEVVFRCLSDAEAEKYRLGKDDFLKFFVAKESLAKAEGKGIRRDIRLIPALPFDGEVVYDGEKYSRKSFTEAGCFFSATVKGGEFDLKVIIV